MPAAQEQGKVGFFIFYGVIFWNIFRYIEAELYDYPFTKEEIESLRDNIIEAIPLPDNAPRAGQRSPTIKWAIPRIPGSASSLLTAV